MYCHRVLNLLSLIVINRRSTCHQYVGSQGLHGQTVLTSITQLYVGLVASVLLTASAIVLIRRVQRAEFHTDIDTSGVLQVAWLLGSEPSLAKVEQPDLEALRVAGMYDVDPDTLRHRRANAFKDSDQLL